LIQNEKHAGIAFPRLDGEIDYRGFLIEDPLGLSWCKDIFEYYWKDALV
ncbi:MAG: transcriptional regulator, partial [Thermoprotei archaeon]